MTRSGWPDLATHLEALPSGELQLGFGLLFHQSCNRFQGCLRAFCEAEQVWMDMK